MKIIECPRDAIQGLKNIIPTQKKIDYYNLLLASGCFDSIDFGSFVSAKTMPQMADTGAIIDKLIFPKGNQTKLLAIIANERGAQEACKFEAISYLGYPFSISETFQLRNTHKTINEAYEQVKLIQDLCNNCDKKLVIYISMGFGNPYHDHWHSDEVLHWVERLQQLGIQIFSISDTIGIAEPQSISSVFNSLFSHYPSLEFGAHFHTKPEQWREKIEAAWDAGCRRYDGAIMGYGGCPMAQDDLVGNMPTENLISFLKEKNKDYPIDNQLIENITKAFEKLIAV